MKLARVTFLALLAAVVSGVFAGCATTGQVEREAFADEIMALDESRSEESREIKWLEAREGSTGGAGGSGGGCACN